MSANQSPTPSQVTPVAAPEPMVFRTPEQRKQDAQRRIEIAAQTRPFKKSLEQTELRMAQLQTQKTDLENRLTTPMATAEIVKASKELGATQGELETLELKWLELSEQIQQIENNNALA